MTAEKQKIPRNFSDRIKQLRQKLGQTQTEFAHFLGVSFATVNRWENNQSQPSPVMWNKLTLVEQYGMNYLKKAAFYDDPEYSEGLIVKDVSHHYKPDIEFIDFSADPEIVRLKVEAERLSYCHLYNPKFASEISLIDPLPHQRIAVYEHLLNKPRLRFLLADDAGAGKTIMAGLYIREMLIRHLIHRILIVTPAGLIGNWERELRKLFNLSFKIITGVDTRVSNPFAGSGSDQLIVSLDTLAGERMFSCLQATTVKPYDLVIFDEAHKLSADREPDFSIRKTERYRLAESLAGATNGDDRWKLDWSCNHIILLSATPHMGKDMPYYFLWRLLEPEILSTFEAFKAYPGEKRKNHFIRRTKEEMLDFNETPLYPRRKSATVSFDLSQGSISEQILYDETTSYIKEHYNRARILNRSAARLAMSIFQRRLCSSTYALMRSFERRQDKIAKWIDDLENKRINIEQLLKYQQSLDGAELDVLDKKTADEEDSEHGREESEIAENSALDAIAVSSKRDLEDELKRVQHLLGMAQELLRLGRESKFERMVKIFENPRFRCEKMIVFTEHRDTLEFLVRRLEGLGYTDRIACIHGGMNYKERERQVELFRKPNEEGGATYLVATDAAGEGINLQFCWLMINYDIPWNPARLEQRMGRIHRYGQRHDPVVIINLVAGKTREGSVLKVLLDKINRIRKEIGSDKVFDCIGRLFENRSLRDYMEEVLNEDDVEKVKRDISDAISYSKVESIRDIEKGIYGGNPDIREDIKRARESMEQEVHKRLLPGYVRHFIEKAVPLMGLAIEGDMEDSFSITAHKPKAFDTLWSLFDTHTNGELKSFRIKRAKGREEDIFLHPGEPFFDGFLDNVKRKIAKEAMKGSVFIDPYAREPYFFHLIQIAIEREADPSFEWLKNCEILEYRLIAVKYEVGGRIEECPLEHLLILNGAKNIPPQMILFASTIEKSCEQVKAYAVENCARSVAIERREKLMSTLKEREDLLLQGYRYKDAELAKARARLSERAREGNPWARSEIERIKKRQKQLWEDHEHSVAVLRREPELISPGEVCFLGHALVVPSLKDEDAKRYDAEIEMIAMNVVRSFEEERGSMVIDVSTPELAKRNGLPEYPGFDFLIRCKDGREINVEVKGRAQSGDITLTENEWAKACNLRDNYWLYVVFNCSTGHPKLLRVRDPFMKLLVKAKGGVIIGEQEIFKTSEEGE